MELLFRRRFAPLFWAQALGAFNDNMFKNALIVVLLLSSAGSSVLVPLAGALFMAPYIVLGALSGRISDRFERHVLVRRTKLLEIALMGLGAAAFMTGSIPLMLLVLTGLGVQATLFSPMKYSILPDHMAPSELVRANGLLEAGTFLSILLGTIAGGAIIAAGIPPVSVGLFGLAVAVLGWVCSLFLLPVKAANPGTPVKWNPVSETVSIIKDAADPVLMNAILGIGWFWTVGAVVMTAFPIIAAGLMPGNASLITVLLGIFAVGTAVGSVFAHKLTNGAADGRYGAAAVLGMAVFIGDFALNSSGASAASGLPDFLAGFTGFRLCCDLFLMAVCGGLVSVPLYSVLQKFSPEEKRSSVIAANNILNAVMMVTGSVVFSVLAVLNVSASSVLLLMAVLNIPACIWFMLKWPHREGWKRFFRVWYRIFHGVRVEGMENIPQSGMKCVFTSNHITYADGILLAAYMPAHIDPVFAVFEGTARAWWAKPILALTDVVTVDWTRPHSLKRMVKSVASGRPLVIFPEGRLTRTGGLMKIYEGAAVVADYADAHIVPVRIEGYEGHPLSRTGSLFGRRWFSPLTLRFFPSFKQVTPPGLKPRERRALLGDGLARAMTESAALSGIAPNLWSALLQTRRFGMKSPVVEEADRISLTRKNLLLRSVVLGRKFLKPGTRNAGGEHVGIMLPNSRAAVVTFYAVQSIGGASAMLNFSAGPGTLVGCCRTAMVERVITSRAFIAKAKLERSAEALTAAGIEVIMLEDIAAGITKADRLRALFMKPESMPGFSAAPADTAAVLFTSGSEGAPKAVLLSHENILSNCAGMRAQFDFTPAERVLNAMPVFHAFGLVGGTILPLLAGCRLIMYPSPLHYRVVPEVAYDVLATIIFATDTFLSGWARFASPEDFTGVRLAFAGAEKLRPETARLYSEKFGVRILEGYGATEASPVISVNTPSHNKSGTVGRLMPRMEMMLLPVPGLEAPAGVDAGGGFGRLSVRGPNIMKGYMKADAPGVLVPPPDGVHDTGDIVAVDCDRHIRIIGRAKRFAKIAGEMVSMGAAENLINSMKPDFTHAVVNVPDPRKGEKLVLVTTSDITASDILAAGRAEGISEIGLPREVIRVSALPMLPTGKMDYPGVCAILTTAETTDEQ